MQEWYSLAGLLISAFAGSIGGVWAMSSKFSDMRALIYSEGKLTRDELTRKIEYHERHDDSRFDHVNNELMAIKLRNAARDGLPVSPVYGQVFETSKITGRAKPIQTEK